MDGLNYMPADGTRAAIKNRGLRHHPDGSSSKNYSVSEGSTGDLFKFKKYFYGAPRSMKMGTIVSPWHSPRAPIDKSAMACDLARRRMSGSVPDFARSSGYPPTAALSIKSVIDAMGQHQKLERQALCGCLCPRNKGFDRCQLRVAASVHDIEAIAGAQPGSGRARRQDNTTAGLDGPCARRVCAQGPGRRNDRQARTKEQREVRSYR